MNSKSKACLTIRRGFVYLRVVFFEGNRSYNTYYKIMKVPKIDSSNNSEYAKIKNFIRNFDRSKYSSSVSIAGDIVKSLYSMVQNGDLNKFDYTPLKQSYEKINSPFPDVSVSFVSTENSFFHKKTVVSSNSSCALESEFQDILKKEQEKGFSLIKKTIRRKSYPDKEYIEYIADFTRTSLPWQEEKKEFVYTSPVEGSYKYLIVSDIHIPYHNSSLLYAILSMCEYEKIKGIVINGDLIDFDFISSYERNASQICQNYIESSLSEALGWINLFAERFETKIYLEGNHDDRIRRNTLGDKIRAFIPSMHPDERMKSVPYNSVASLFLLPIKGYDCYGYGQSVTIGNYQIYHGEETNKNIAKDRVYYNSIIGHTHRSEMAYNPVYKEDGKYSVRNKVRCGCLLDLKSDIPSSSFKSRESWVNGFSVLTHFKGNICAVENVVCNYDYFVYRDKMWSFNN